MKKVSENQVASPDQAMRADLPEAVQASLGELAGAAREGLLAVCVGLGLGAMQEIMAAEVEQVVGPKGKHDPKREANRHGTEKGSVTLGGRRVGVERPRMRSADGGAEVPLASYEQFSSRDPLTELVFERMLAGVGVRRFAQVNEPVGSEVEAEGSSDSRSAVSREFVAKTRTALGELMARRLDDVRLAVMMVDALEISGRTHVVALGITTEGVKLPLGLWEGSTENAALATSLLADLVDRGLDPEQGILLVIDGAKALRKAIRDVFGTRAPVQRCVRHYADVRVMPTLVQIPRYLRPERRHNRSALSKAREPPPRQRRGGGPHERSVANPRERAARPLRHRLRRRAWPPGLYRKLCFPAAAAGCAPEPPAQR